MCVRAGAVGRMRIEDWAVASMAGLRFRVHDRKLARFSDFRNLDISLRYKPVGLRMFAEVLTAMPRVDPAATCDRHAGTRPIACFGIQCTGAGGASIRGSVAT